MYQIFFVLCNDERNFQYCNTARCSSSYSYSLPPPHMPPKVAMWLLHFWPNPKRAQPDSASTYATLLAVASLDQATICTRIDFTRFILMFFTPLQNLAWLQVCGAGQRAEAGHRQRHLRVPGRVRMPRDELHQWPGACRHIRSGLTASCG